MSRVPIPTSRATSRTSTKSPSTPSKSGATLAPPTSTPVRTRTKSAATPVKPRTTTPTPMPVRTRTKSTTKPATPSRPKAESPPPVPSPAALSIKEAIALKRAEAKKTKRPGSGLATASPEDEAPPSNDPGAEEDLYGRQSVRETIQKARSTGNLNLATRNLPCIPSILFEIHLSVKPEPLQSVPTEPPYGSDHKQGAWYDGEDLKTLRMGNNEVIEIQPEISMFGSLRILDMHKNKLTSIPSTIADLPFLSSLDLSWNNLSSLPDVIFALPELTVLNLSHNSLTSIPFGAYFANPSSRNEYASDDFFAPAINRSISPLPRLVNLDISHNKLRAEAIDISHIPVHLLKLDISHNPLGIRNPATRTLVRSLGDLYELQELHLHHSEIGDDAFPSDLSSSSIFPALRAFQVEDTAVTPAAMKAALQGLQQVVTYEITTEMPPEGTLRVGVGKVIVKEAWEIEAENRLKARRAIQAETQEEWNGTPIVETPKRFIPVATKESWEIEAEQGLLTEGAKRRMRAQAAAAASSSAFASEKKVEISKPKEIVKESWEIDAEQGLLTEGGKRRARAQAALKAQEEQQQQRDDPSRGTSPLPHAFSLSNSQYYDATSHSLTLPPSAPPPKAGHFRAFSLALSPSAPRSSSPPSDIALPTPTLPLTPILAQPFADTLRTLVLTNRRMDRCFSLPLEDGPYLPNLEELDLEACDLTEHVPIVRSDSASGSATPTRTTESLLPLIARLFPSLQALNLSFNGLSGDCLTTGVLSSLILCTSQRKGLKRLGLRGNKITELEGFKGLADGFKGHRDVPGWKLEELDLRDNEIGRIPPELGLLPLDVFLVDGNIFRVPARRIWEREGTKGLLSWLRGRIE